MPDGSVAKSRFVAEETRRGHDDTSLLPAFLRLWAYQGRAEARSGEPFLQRGTKGCKSKITGVDNRDLQRFHLELRLEKRLQKHL